ncbi:hypothetical protein ABOM_000176 [Aspergillus bombycis]|uniref:Uncharacterized protein n=1 Tax=Aspergillus bombycis TaxID=109264 RepID=A0A1F8AH69_9EURO|nr:hypothetical protein ABOM_000176 [Aspergillus bombycis]OGM51103.1 hypothetical protein ABOM_000176 [Aspergillus bombycis]
METLVSYGVTYLLTNNSTLATVVAAVYGLFLKSSTNRLSVSAILLCQSPEYSLTKSDIDEFLSRSYGRDNREWSCTRTTIDENYEGPAQTAVHINLEHESMLYDDSLRELPIRQLCSKLVGLHTFKEHRFRIVPDRAGEDLDDIGQLFGSCLVLMHLKDIYERCSGDDLGDDGCYSEGRFISLFQKFADEYGEYIESLSDAKVFEILGDIDDPKFGRMLNELRKRLTKRTLRN